MVEGADLTQDINTFNQIISGLLRTSVKFDEEDKALMLLTSLLSSYGHQITTMLWRKETLEIEEVMTTQLAWNQHKHDRDEGCGEWLAARIVVGRKKEID
jgi:hypothetical protein